MAKNQENLELYENNEELFKQERSKLGGLLLLKGLDNQSSGNKKYKDKLKTYSGTNIWNQTLLEDFYKSNTDFKQFMKKYNLPFKPIPKLSRDLVDMRGKLLFEMVKMIWGEG